MTETTLDITAKEVIRKCTKMSSRQINKMINILLKDIGDITVPEMERELIKAQAATYADVWLRRQNGR